MRSGWRFYHFARAYASHNRGRALYHVSRAADNADVTAIQLLSAGIFRPHRDYRLQAGVDSNPANFKHLLPAPFIPRKPK